MTIPKALELRDDRESLYVSSDDRDETINDIIHDWEGKVIHWELCKKLKFD